MKRFFNSRHRKHPASLLEAARHVNSVRAIVIVTSDKCYSNQEWPWRYRETDALGGGDPYSASKACAELVTSAYRKSFFAGSGGRSIAVATVRAGNVIGGGDWAKDRLVPDIIGSLIEGRDAVIRYPQAIRPWQHVLEPLGGYLLLAGKQLENGGEYSEGWNFSPLHEHGVTVREVAERIVKLWGEDAAAIRHDGALQPPEAGMLRLDSSKARQVLGWQPMLGLEDTLRWTVDWYKAFADGRNMRDVTLEQLREYCCLLKQKRTDLCKNGGQSDHSN